MNIMLGKVGANIAAEGFVKCNVTIVAIISRGCDGRLIHTASIVLASDHMEFFNPIRIVEVCRPTAC